LRLDPGNDLVSTHTCSRRAKLKKFSPQSAFISPRTGHKISAASPAENDRKLIFRRRFHFVVTDEFTLPETVSLLAIYPHHTISRAICSPGKLPAQNKNASPHFPLDLNAAVFTYATPVDLPAVRRFHAITRQFRKNPANRILRSACFAGIAQTDEWRISGCKFPQNSPNAALDPRRVLQKPSPAITSK